MIIYQLHYAETILSLQYRLVKKTSSTNLGTWQCIYLYEFRDYGGAWKVVATIMGE